jgi:hypothetical protein
MTTEEFIIWLFCCVDDAMSDVPKHPQAKLYPSELVTIGLLFALKGSHFRAFYRWLARDYAGLFVGLPERTRLQRGLQVHQEWCQRFLAPPTLFTVIDSYGIELLHPIREARSQHPLGKKGMSNRRWIVGVKLCWLVNAHGQVVAWAWDTANVHDQRFRPLAHRFDGETITLCDRGFVKTGEPLANLKVCAVKTWSERMIIETMFSLLTRVFHLKHLFHRTAHHLSARFAYTAAAFNLLVTSSGSLHLAQFAL